ncbi:MAG: hypothetical protein WD334_11115, partial [Chitinophagales bacterium]
MIFLIVAVRLKAFFHGSSLMIDEANVARNIAERGFLQLWQNLDYEQYAPPLFLTIVKISTLIFGMNEYALRLPALLASLLCIYLIIRLCRHPGLQLNNWYISIALVLFGSSYIMLMQSNMLKQYTTDAMLALFFVLIAINSNYKQFFKASGILLWTIMGVLSIWSSMPVVFVLAAVGLYFFKQSVDAGEWKKFMLYFSFLTGVWALNFFLYFFFLLKSDAESSYLQNYHGQYFLDYALWQKEAWIQNWKIIKGLINAYIGSSAIAIVWFLVLLAAGKIYLAKSKKGYFLLFLLPISFAALASFLNYYSFIPRLLLFSMPLIFVVLVLGFRWLWNETPIFAKAFLLLSTVFVLMKMNGWIYLHPEKHCLMEETREVMDELKNDIRSGTAVFVNHEGSPAITFYVQYHDNKEKYSVFKDFRWIFWNEDMVEEASNYLKNSPERKLCIIWGHSLNHLINNDVKAIKAKGYRMETDIEKW